MPRRDALVTTRHPCSGGSCQPRRLTRLSGSAVAADHSEEEDDQRDDSDDDGNPEEPAQCGVQATEDREDDRDDDDDDEGEVHGVFSFCRRRAWMARSGCLGGTTKRMHPAGAPWEGLDARRSAVLKPEKSRLGGRRGAVKPP